MAETVDQAQLTKRYQDALDAFVEKAKQDPNLIAVILQGSLAYDKVWAKSDIDLFLVVRDQKLETTSYCIDEDNIVINVSLMTRSDFRGHLGSARGGLFSHSINAKARVIYTTDESIAEYLADIQHLGADDIESTFFRYATELVGLMEKTEKWLVVRNDPLYAQFYILRMSGLLADMKLLLVNEIPNRESLPRMMSRDRDFMSPFYERPMTGKMTKEEVVEALDAIRQFLIDHLDLLARPVIRFMDEGEIKTVTMLVKHFGIWSHDIYHIFEFLAEMKVIEKVTETIRITPKGKKLVEEIAFIYVGNLGSRP